MKPRHDDEIADYRAAFENLCVSVPRIFKSQRNVGANMREDNFASNLIRYLRI